MAKNICPECEGELVRTPTKKKGMVVLKHKDPAKAKQAGCGMGFITVREKGAVTNGNQEETRQTTQGGGANRENETGGGYREVVNRSTRRRGKTGGRSQGRSQQNVPARAAAASSSGNNPDQPARGTAKRGWLSDVTDDIFK